MSYKIWEGGVYESDVAGNQLHEQLFAFKGALSSMISKYAMAAIERH